MLGSLFFIAALVCTICVAFFILQQRPSASTRDLQERPPPPCTTPTLATNPTVNPKLLADWASTIQKMTFYNNYDGNPVSWDSLTKEFNTFLSQGIPIDHPVSFSPARLEGAASPLFHAISMGQHALVQLLISNGALIEQVNKKGQTPLIALFDNLDISEPRCSSTLKVLLDNKARLDVEDGEGHTPLWWAIFNYPTIAASFLIENNLCFQTYRFGVKNLDAIEYIQQHWVDTRSSDEERTTYRDIINVLNSRRLS
jgi:hypothetical protein